MSDVELLTRLSKWYQSQCNGDWEHQWGVAIDTLDNPGWIVKIDLRETASERKVFSEIQINNGDNDWVRCSVQDAKFTGAGDPSKLAMILDHFLTHVGA